MMTCVSFCSTAGVDDFFVNRFDLTGLVEFQPHVQASGVPV